MHVFSYMDAEQSLVDYQDHHVHDVLKAIYVITVNGKSYVGQAKNTRRRFSQHAREDSQCRYVRDAIQKHGVENARVRIVERDLTPEWANVMESFYIEMLGTLAPNGYNLTTGGDSYEVSDVTREKLSDVAKELWQDPEHREKMSDSAKDRWEDPEYHEKHSAINKERWQDPENRRQQSERLKTLWQDPEYRKKMSEIHKERCQDPEYREKMSDISKGCWQDPEYREKMSEIHKERRQNPEYREKLSDAAKDRWQDPENRRQQSERLKTLWQDSKNRQQQSERLKKRWQDPEFIARQQLESKKRMGEKMNDFVEIYEKHAGDAKKIIEDLSISMSTFRSRRSIMNEMYFL